MPQAGLHALVGVVTRKQAVRKPWLFLGILLGSIFPDMDNYLVAVGTVTGIQEPDELFHRTFTHSVFTILFILVLFYVAALVRKDDRWKYFGYGMGVGVAMHMALDLLIWFNGVPIFWPLGSELNFWANYNPPEALVKILNPAELLFFGLYFYWLLRAAQSNNTNVPLRPAVRRWMNVMYLLFIVFAILAYVELGSFRQITELVFGLTYLIALTAAFVLTIRMRRSFEVV